MKDNQVKLNTEELKTYEDIQNDIYYQFEKKFGWIACMEPTSKLFYERKRIKGHFGFQKI